jgi:hypothetical protein
MIFVLGSSKYTFAAGVADDMPFFGVCELPEDQASTVYINEDAKDIIERFSKNGVIVYFDNQIAAENFHKSMAFVFERAMTATDWPEHGSKEKMQ